MLVWEGRVLDVAGDRGGADTGGFGLVAAKLITMNPLEIPGDFP